MVISLFSPSKSIIDKKIIELQFSVLTSRCSETNVFFWLSLSVYLSPGLKRNNESFGYDLLNGGKKNDKKILNESTLFCLAEVEPSSAGLLFVFVGTDI